MPGAHVLILNYNGEEMLGETLPTLIEALKHCRFPARLSVIDNESTDRSIAKIKSDFPSIGIIPNKNRVLCSYNDVVRDLPEDIVVFLNNDLKVRADFLEPLIEHFFQDPLLFAVAPKAMDYEGREILSWANWAHFSGGIIRVENQPANKRDDDKASFTFSAGCAGAFDRKKFLSLGGYDDLYLPGTLEDVDLCFRAWSQGYRCLFEPRSLVFHRGQASFHKRFGRRGTAKINARNHFFFVWKNIRDLRLWAMHAVLLPFKLGWHILRGQAYWIEAFFEALSRVPEVTQKRRALPPCKYTDREVLSASLSSVRSSVEK